MTMLRADTIVRNLMLRSCELWGFRVAASASKRTRVSSKKGTAAKNGKSTAGSKKGNGRKARGPDKPSKPARLTVASVFEKLEELSEQIGALERLVRASLDAKPSADAAVDDAARAQTPIDAAGFDGDLLKILAELDRRGRHDGLVPIPEVRNAFLERGWTRRTFDDRLLQAEREFVVDLKTADDPKHLAEPELSIREQGRGHLQYVVAR